MGNSVQMKSSRLCLAIIYRVSNGKQLIGSHVCLIMDHVGGVFSFGIPQLQPKFFYLNEFYMNPWKSRNFSCLADNRLAQRNLCENNIGLIDDQFMLEDRERSCRIPCRGEYLNIDWTGWSLCQPINCRSEAMVRSAKRYRHKISFLPDKTFLEPKIEIQQRDCVTWSCFSYKQNRSGCFR